VVLSRHSRWAYYLSPVPAVGCELMGWEDGAVLSGTSVKCMDACIPFPLSYWPNSKACLRSGTQKTSFDITFGGLPSHSVKRVPLLGDEDG
jgi:hypothetical protein